MQQNGGEVTNSIKDMPKRERMIQTKRMTQQDLIDEEDLKICILGIFRNKCFSSMLPSMPKGEIVSMNADAMGEHCRTQ